MGEGTYSKGGLGLNSQVLQQHLTCGDSHSRSGWRAVGKRGLRVKGRRVKSQGETSTEVRKRTGQGQARGGPGCRAGPLRKEAAHSQARKTGGP